MSNFEAYPHFPVLKLRTRDHDEIPQLPKEILVEHVQLAKAHPMSVIEASLMGTIKTPPPRPQVRYLPSLMPIQTQFDILEARLDVLYQKCESVVKYQCRFVTDIITYTQRLLALAPGLTPNSPALGEHRERGRQLKQRLVSVKFEISLVHRALFSEVRAPLNKIEETLSRTSAALNMPISSRIFSIQVRIMEGERYLIIYDHVFNKTSHRLWDVLFGRMHIHRSSREFQQLLHSLIRRWGFSVDGSFLACFDSPTNEVPTGNLAMGLAREVSAVSQYLASLRQSSLDPIDYELENSGLADAVRRNTDYDGSSADHASISGGLDIDSLDRSNTSLSSRSVDVAISHGWPYIPLMRFVDDDDSDLETD